MNEIKPGKYKHFKGNFYEVLYTATNSETLEDMVVYRALYGERGIWVRPASMWNELVNVDGKSQPRFAYFGETADEQLTIQVIDGSYSVCKVEILSETHLAEPHAFAACTNDENSLVCLTKNVPKNIIAREDGWRAFMIVGTLDFSLVGILAKISGILAREGIGIFAVSTYNTDYIFVRSENLQKALDALQNNGYIILK